MSLVSSLLLFDDLLDIQVCKLILDLGLLLSKLGFIQLSSASQTLLKRIVLLLLVFVSLLHHLLVVAVATLHEVHEFVTHLSFICGTHSELVTDRLLLSLKLVLFLLL